MNLDEMRMLTEFCDGYKKLCEETGVYLSANNEGELKPSFMERSCELSVEFQEYTGSLSVKPQVR